MSTFADYPLKELSYITARECAREESIEHPDHFIYMIKLSSGGYVIDHKGVIGDDEKLIRTFKKGEEI